MYKDKDEWDNECDYDQELDIPTWEEIKD